MDLSNKLLWGFKMARRKNENSTLDSYFPDDNLDENKKEEGCKVCGDPIDDKTFQRCRSCLNKLALIDDLNELLEYVSPSESFREIDLINKGIKRLKLNLLISKFLKEELILINLDGMFTLNNIDFLNDFLLKYGEKERPLKSEDYPLAKKDDSVYINLNDYSKYIRIKFNPRIDKWQVEFYNDSGLAQTKSFFDSFDANKEAIYYIRQLGVVGSSNKKEEKSKKMLYSSYEGIYYSPRRGMWGAKVKGFKGSKFIGHFKTEEEAYNARLKYLENKEKTRQKFISEKRGLKSSLISQSSGELVYFSKQKGKWIVRLKNKEGQIVNVGQFDTEEEANKAKEEFQKENS